MIKNSGFTLIETIIYIALFSLLLGTAFMTAFQLIDGSNRLSVKNTVQSEGNFVMRKIDWALTGVKTITTPATGSSSNLAIKKHDGTDVYVQQNGSKIEMKENTGSFLAITTDNVTVKVSSLNFQYINPSGTGPAGITATFTITKDGTDFPFTVTKYIRK